MDELERAALLAERSKLKRAMRSGVLTVTHGEKSVKYRSLAEMQTALTDIDTELGEVDGVRRRRVRYFSTTKGL